MRRRLAWAALPALFALGLYLCNEVRIDSCLDRGGRWDADQRRCESATE
jgi:hypothetical protein